MTDPLDFTERPTILAVDDTPDNLTLISGVLRDKYKVQVANSGERALKIALGEQPPDLVLLDIMMPGMDGYEVCRRLMADARTRDIPIIFLTARSSIEDEQAGFELGAADYIIKPFSPPIVLARVKTQLMLKSARDFLRGKSEYLEAEVARRVAETAAIQDFTIAALSSLATLADSRDSIAGNHIQRTRHYVKALAERLADHPRFAASLTRDRIDTMFKAAPLYDIGKIGIPDRIFRKAAPLTPEEFAVLKSHTTLGYDAIERAERSVGAPLAFLGCAKEMALSHEERWDGSGYPRSLRGDEIPVSARLMAIADTYDVLMYSPGIPHDQALKIVAEGRGMQFDPDIADAFLAIADTLHEIATRYPDFGAPQPDHGNGSDTAR